MNRTRPSIQKREREKSKRERQQQKVARRDETKARRASEPQRSGLDDSDLAAIVPGPQPKPWDDEV
ncbi:MAG: hypothetical protein AABY89_01660 [Acidobacteriota bacterium]